MKGILVFFGVMLVLLSSGCVSDDGTATGDSGGDVMTNSVAVFDTSMGTFKVEMFEDRMPITTGL